MKVNIKGLVFVGFAAAILSGAAKADDKQIVTSKAFTEATYQKKIGGTAGQLPVTTAAAGTVEYKTIETNKTGITTNADTIPTSAAVAGAIADANSNANGRQTASTANFQVGAEGGAWKQIVTDDYTALAVDNTDTSKVNLTVAVTTDGTLANAVNSTGDNSADYNKLTTGHAVKAYADSKIASSVADNDTTHAPSGDAVHDALALKQNANTAVTHTASTGVGSATQPVYIAADGTATATTHSLGMTVPTAPGTNAANQVLAGDGTWKGVFGGADGTNAGTTGLVTAPAATDNTKFLKGDGTWADPANTTYSADSTTITLTGTTFSATTGSVASNNSGLVTGATVYNYLNGQAFPALPTGDDAACDASHPCALVSTGGQPQWIRMAQ